MMAERNLNVDHVTIWRWLQRYAPELQLPPGASDDKPLLEGGRNVSPRCAQVDLFVSSGFDWTAATRQLRYQMKPDRAAVIPAHWNLYEAVEDADALARCAGELSKGGWTIFPPSDHRLASESEHGGADRGNDFRLASED